MPLLQQLSQEEGESAKDGDEEADLPTDILVTDMIRLCFFEPQEGHTTSSSTSRTL
jgi:hypothetical protein